MDSLLQDDVEAFGEIYRKHCGQKPNDLQSTYYAILRNIQSPEVSAGYLWDKMAEKERFRSLYESLTSVKKSLEMMPRFLSEKVAIQVFDKEAGHGSVQPFEDVLPAILETVEECHQSFEDHANWGEGARRFDLVAFNIVAFAVACLKHEGVQFSITEHSRYPTPLQAFVAEIACHFGVDCNPRSAIRNYAKETSHTTA